MRYKYYYPEDQQGIALIVTLLALALITGMVVEFSYGVYTGTQSLYNWRDSQRLSMMAKSGVNVSSRLLPEMVVPEKFSYPAMEFPVENPFEDFEGKISLRIEDESSKFNINSIVSQNNRINEPAYKSFRRLLGVLSLNEEIADRVAEWIQRKRESGSSLSGTGSKYYKLHSVDELLLIDGIGRRDYDKLLPYVTVYGSPDGFAINVNGAAKPVLMSISGPGDEVFPITEDLADKITKFRELTPFDDIGSFSNFTGTSFSVVKVTTTGKFFHIKSVASSGGVKRVIETVLNTDTAAVLYWKEY